MRSMVCLWAVLYAHIFGMGIVPGYGQEAMDEGFVAYLATWGEKGSGLGQFREPQGISVGPGGFLYVADTGNHRIQKFDPTGRVVGEIGGIGWEKELFDHPVALSAKNGLDVFVADYFNQRIERYDKDLHYLASFLSSEEWAEHLRFGFPIDVDISNQGELFCLDAENHRVLKLDVFGEPQLSFGDFDAGEGRLVEPRRMMVSGQDRVYVSDEEEGRIVVFDIHGNYLVTLGEGVLEKPMGMAEMAPGLLLVVDEEKKSVFVFQGLGGLVGSFGGEEVVGRAFAEPVDVACWRDRVYVLDKKRCVVDVFLWNPDEEKRIR